MTYQEGHVRRNPATREVAVRTTFPDDVSNPMMARLAWLIGTTSMGARNAHTSEVEQPGWVDLFVPEPESEEEQGS